MKTTILLAFSVFQVFTASAQGTFTNLAALLTTAPATYRAGATFEVLGLNTKGDWGGPIWYTYQPVAPARTSVVAVAFGSGGLYHDWDGDIRKFGVKGDGVTDDAPAFQAVLDYVEGLTNLTSSGGTVWIPDRMRIKVGQTIQMRRGVNIFSRSGRNADRGYPMDQTAPRFIAAPGLRAPIFEFVDYTNTAAANPRMIVLKGLVFDGNLDNQSTNDLQLSAISIRSTLAKNISIEGCAFYDTPGWSIFALDGFNAGNIRDCFLGNGLFATVSADLKISDTDITGRTRGSLAAGTPYPPIWLGPYSQKNQFSDIMVYMGPRAEVGYDNSLRRWSISSANAAANTLTLATTNGLFDGLPVVWRSAGALPSGALTNQTYHVLWSGSATIQLATSSGYRTRTAVDFGAVSLSSDVLQLGEPSMLYCGGGSTVSQNAFSNFRVEDSYADLVYLDGAHDNAFSNPMFGFSYTNTGRYVKLMRGAQGNTFNGGMMAWNFPNQFGQQPQTIVGIDAESKANRFQGVRMSNASVQTVIDANVTEPGNVWDYEEPSTMWMRGLDASFRFWDYNSAITNSMWWNGNSVFWTLNEADPLNTYDWGFDGSNQILEIHGSTAPGLRIQGYNASSAPSITFRNKGGTRASPTQTAANATLGSLFFAGRDTSADTSARAAITAVTPATGWPSTTDTPAELWFAVTPDGTATRTNLFGIQGDLTSADTPLMVSIGGAAPSRVKKAQSGTLYVGTYTGWVDGNRGDVTINGTNLTINADSVALGADTTGNFISTIAAGIGISVSGSGTESAAVTIAHDIEAGPNISLSTNGNKLRITASTGTSATNGTPFSFEGSPPLTAVNVIDSADLDFTLTASTNLSAVLKADSVELGAVTTGNYIATVAGTANEITITGSGAESAAITVSLPSVLDLGGKTSFEIPNAASPITTIFGQIAGKNNAWGTSRGTIQMTDGTETVYVLALKGSDTPTAGQVPTYNSDGTWTAETPAAASSSYIVSSTTAVEVVNSDATTLLFDYTIPGGTLSANGDELEIWIPLTYMMYTGQVNAFEANLNICYGATGETSMTYTAPTGLSFVSTTYGGFVRCRVKRMSSTTYTSITEFVIGADGSSDTAALVYNTQYRHAIALDSTWSDAIRFALPVTLGDANTLHSMKALGYTIRKLR
jgi:hypothetical protein